MIIHLDDGRYAHMPECNAQCSKDGHWLQQSVPAPWQAPQRPEENGSDE